MLSGDMAGLEAALRRSEKALESTGSRLQSVGTRLSLGVTAPLVALGLAAGASAISFEQAMAGVAKTVDAPAEQVAHLGEQFTALSEQIPVARNELAGIAEEAGQLGVAFASIPGFTRTVADLRVATDLGQEAGNSMARLANIMGQRANPEFQRMGSTIVALGNDGASTEREIANMALRIAGAGRQIDLSIAEVMGFASALSSLGIESEAGGTAISRVFADIASAVASGGEKLESLAGIAGLSAADFRAAFEADAAGAVVTFIEGLGRLSAAGENVFAVLEAVEFADIRVRDALLRTAGAGDLLRSQIALGNRAWQENTALTTEAERFYATTGNQLVVLRNRLANVAGELGAVLVPALIEAVDASGPLIDVVRSMIEMFAAAPSPIQTMVVASGALAAMAGPLAFALGTAASAASALSGGAALAVRGLAAMRGVLAVGGLVLSVRSFADAATLARRAVAGLGSVLAPGGLVLVGLGLLAGLLVRNRMAALQAAEAFEHAKWKIVRSIADMSEEQARATLIREAEMLAQNEAALEKVRQQIDDHKKKLSQSEAALGPGMAVPDPVRDDTLLALERQEQQLVRTLELQKTAAVEAAKRWDALARARQAASGTATITTDLTLPQTDAVAEAHRELATALQAAAGMEQLLGAAFDANEARAGAYRAALQALLEEGVDPGSARLQEYAAALVQAEAAIRAADDAEKAANETKRARDQLQSEALSLVEQAMTAEQRHEQQVRRLNEALNEGLITQEMYRQGIAHVDAELRKATGSLAATMKEQGLMAGEALIRGLISGSRDMGEILKSALLNLALSYIMGPLKLALGIASPSKVFMGYGQAIGEGLVIGIDSTVGRVSRAMGHLVSAVQPPALQPAFALASPSPGVVAMSGAGRIDIDPSKLPRPLTPFEAARDQQWQQLFRETGIVARSQGFGG